MPTHSQRLSLTALQRYLHWAPPRHASILVASDVDNSAVMRWVQRYPNGVKRTKALRTPVHSAHTYQMQLSQRQQVAATTCRALRAEESVAAEGPGAASNEFFVLNDCARTARRGVCADSVYMLPFTLAALASHVRQDRAFQLSSSATQLPAGLLTAPQLEGRGTVTSTLDESTGASGLCAPHSKNFFIAELTTISPSRLMDAITVAVHQLERNGAFLLLSPERFHVPHKTKDYLNWQFGSCRLGNLPGSLAFLFCSGLTGDACAPHLPQSSFPGFLPRGVRRKRRWDRYGRNRNLYVANLSPHFGRSAVPKDLLEEDLRRKQERSDEFDQRSNDFFGVSHDMVENRRYDSKPEE